MSIFFKILIYLTPMGLSCGSRDLFCIKQDLSLWPWGLWRMPALPLWYLGLLAVLHVGSYIPNQGLNKHGVPFVARQILNLEFLWPPGMSYEKSVFWRSYLYSYNQYFFIHNNPFFFKQHSFIPFQFFTTELVRPQRLSRLKESIRVSLHGEIKE